MSGDVPGERWTDDGEALLRLPDELRSAFKEPFGPLYTDAEQLLAEAGTPLIAVGDIVTYTIEATGRRPDVALVDGRTERQAVDDRIRAAVGDGDCSATNPPGTLTESLLTTLAAAVAAEEPVRIVVDGEEDLATVPAVIVAPIGSTVVYGQPAEGMVAIEVTAETQAEFRELLSEFEGDAERALSILDD